MYRDSKMNIEIYQICYSKELLENIPENFHALDNSENLRPDWREYWPIRNFLHKNSLEEKKLYGFFSPKFSLKTGLNFEEILAFMNNNYNGEDIVTFSPFWDLSTFFVNSIEQGDFFQPGLYKTFHEFIGTIKCDTNLLNKPSPMEKTAFCNYFIATKKYWLKWLNLGEKLFLTGEANDNLAGNLLSTNTLYGNQNIPMKIFIQERLTDYLFLEDKSITSIPYNALNMPSSITPFNNYKEELIKCNALKQAHFATGNCVYYEAFLKERSTIANDIVSKHPFLREKFNSLIKTQ
jgi:hypothetical protein